MMKLSALWQTPSPFTEASESEVTLFNKHVGSLRWWSALTRQGSQVDVTEFLASWEANAEKFKKEINPFLLY
jgi:hypothetical protein